MRAIRRFSSLCVLPIACLILFVPSRASALGPQNVLVVVSAKSPDGLAVANYYRARRGIPGENIVRVRVSPTESVDDVTLRRAILSIVEHHIDRYELHDRISVIATTPGIPILVDENSISSVLFFGDVQPPVADPRRPGQFNTKNPYLDSMRAWYRPADAKAGGGYLHMHIDAGSFDATREMIDRSIRADGSFPDGTVYFFDGKPPRDSRKPLIPSAVQLLGMLGIKAEHRPGWWLEGASDVLGYQTGYKTINASHNQYVPGALGDHLTSYGGRLRRYQNQSPAIDFLKAGCSATYGTLVEPYNYPAKFPMPQLFAFYGLGFTAVESYWMSVLWPQQGLFIGDPLTRPFQKAPVITFNRLTPESEVKGTINYEVLAEAIGPGGGVRKVEVGLDRRLVQQRAVTEVPIGTSVTIKAAGRTAEYTSTEPLQIGDFVGFVGREVSVKGVQVAAKPGMLFLQLPDQDEQVAVRSSSPFVGLEVIGAAATNDADDNADPATESTMQWQLTGASGTGDKLILVIREGNKEVSTIVHEISFPRPAASVCTSFWLDASSKLPPGYSIDNDLEPGKAKQGIINLVADPSKSALQPTASLRLEQKPDSTLEISGKGSEKVLAGTDKGGSHLKAIRFSLGAMKLRIPVQLDTTAFPDGRHHIEVSAVRGAATEVASHISIPVVIRNGTERLTLKQVRTAVPVISENKVLVAHAEMTPGVKGNLIFLIDDVEVPAEESLGGSLQIDPSYWGEGDHTATARIIENSQEVLFSDNAIEFTIGR